MPLLPTVFMLNATAANSLHVECHCCQQSSCFMPLLPTVFTLNATVANAVLGLIARVFLA